MFGHGKLLREGVCAEGVVIDANHRVTSGGAVYRKYDVKVRVHVDDQTIEVHETLDASEVGEHVVGGLVPVRYNPEHPSKAVIDVPALRTRHEANSAKATANAIARGERLAGEKTKP
jgi:hypothetical protein